jgi:hypothetical protein
LTSPLLYAKEEFVSVPSEIAGLIERLNQELNEIEREATEGLALSKAILEHFPDNARI